MSNPVLNENFVAGNSADRVITIEDGEIISDEVIK